MNTLKNIKRFQFYLSSIKSIRRIQEFITTIKFQFYLSSIKSFIGIKPKRLYRRFNSTLVQLKGKVSLPTFFNGRVSILP